jgi:hypothetical protein
LEHHPFLNSSVLAIHPSVHPRIRCVLFVCSLIFRI